SARRLIVAIWRVVDQRALSPQGFSVVERLLADYIRRRTKLVGGSGAFHSGLADWRTPSAQQMAYHSAESGRCRHASTAASPVSKYSALRKPCPNTVSRAPSRILTMLATRASNAACPRQLPKKIQVFLRGAAPASCSKATSRRPLE